MKKIRTYYFLIGIALLINYGCTKTDNPAGMPQLFVPTAFTPNGDHVNDIFTVIPQSNVPLTYYHISIYESDNILVYQSNNINGGWDGTFNGQPQPDGSYLWIIKCQTEGSPVYTSSGYVELIR